MYFQRRNTLRDNENFEELKMILNVVTRIRFYMITQKTRTNNNKINNNAPKTLKKKSEKKCQKDRHIKIRVKKVIFRNMYRFICAVFFVLLGKYSQIYCAFIAKSHLKKILSNFCLLLFTFLTIFEKTEKTKKKSTTMS